MHRLHFKLTLLATALLLTAVVANAQASHSRADFAAQIGPLRTVVSKCQATAANCSADAVPDDEIVAAQGTLPQFTAHWDWLRDALASAKAAKPEDRRKSMVEADAHLNDWLQETDNARPAVADAEYGLARKTANDVLARSEFSKVAPPSWWDRALARFYASLDRFWLQVGKLGDGRPWLGKLLEWLLFSAAAVALLLFVRRNFQRQHLQTSLRGAAQAATAWDREANDWAAMADRAAADEDWREGVHCLYWAAIVRLESRRAWRHNPSRTPREYVRLLKPGSVPRDALGGLTGLLERIWYGLRPAEQDDYRRARAWFNRLSETGSTAVGTEHTASAQVAGGDRS